MKTLVLLSLSFLLAQSLLPFAAQANEKFVNIQIQMLNKQKENILADSTLKADRDLCENFVVGLAINRTNAVKAALQLGSDADKILTETEILSMEATCGRSFSEKAIADLQEKIRSSLASLQSERIFQQKEYCNPLLLTLQNERQEAIETAKALNEDSTAIANLALPTPEGICQK